MNDQNKKSRSRKKSPAGSYTRLLSKEERSQISPKALAWLIKLLDMGSINREQFETIVDLSMSLQWFYRRPINRKMMSSLAETVIFTQHENPSIKELTEFVLKHQRALYTGQSLIKQ